MQVLKNRYPGTDYIYVGDTARLPYGTKGAETIIRYATGVAEPLLAKDGIDALVIACNTASAYALQPLRDMAGPDIPVYGMIRPAATDAAAATANNHICVIATQSTINNGSYVQALHDMKPGLTITAIPCQMLVALAEEGWAEGPVADMIVREYLGSLFAPGNPSRPDTLILGCTHFPVLSGPLRKVTGDGVRFIHCGEAAASRLEKLLGSDQQGAGQCVFRVTDDPQRFAARAAQFFDSALRPQDVELINL